MAALRGVHFIIIRVQKQVLNASEKFDITPEYSKRLETAQFQAFCAYKSDRLLMWSRIRETNPRVQLGKQINQSCCLKSCQRCETTPEVKFVQIQVDDRQKLVSLWLTNAEKDDARVCELVRLLGPKYKREGFLVAVFKSGTKDIFAGTRDLLLENM